MAKVYTISVLLYTLVQSACCFASYLSYIIAFHFALLFISDAISTFWKPGSRRDELYPVLSIIPTHSGQSLTTSTLC
uniref:Putative secreted protein n=1 Tax=Anopheles darlingi TaxID=43151 RepID=A0A2M4DAT3_ANODA